MPDKTTNPPRESDELLQRAHLAAIVRSSEDAIISKDLNGIITTWNKGAEKIFGYTDAEAIGNPVTMLIPPHRLDEEPVILDRIRRGEQINHYETVRRRKDGAEINISLTVSPIRDETGKIIGASKIARDITERVRTEEILRENQMMLALAMRSSRMGAWEQELASDIVLWSSELEDIFGLEKGSFGQTKADFYELIHEDDREYVWSEVEKAVAEQNDYVVEFRFYHGDGSIRWMEGRGQAVYSAKGEPVRLYGIGIDITERRSNEAALRKSEELYRTLFDLVPVAVYTCDADGLIQEFNQRAVELWGREPQRNDPDGKFCGSFKIFYPDGTPMPPEKSPMARALRGEILAPEELEILVERPDGERRNIIPSPLLLKNELGEPTGAINCLFDVTESKQNQEKLISVERRAAEDYQVLLARVLMLAQTFGAARNLSTIYRTVGEFIRTSMPCSAFFISFYDRAKSLRTAAYAWGMDGEVDISTLPPMKLTKDGGPNSQAIFNKESVITNHYWDFMQKRPHIVLQRDGKDPNSSVVVPMKVMNRILGTFEVQAYEEDAYTQEHIVALEMVANLAAVAIENVRLLEVEARARLQAEAANRAKDEFLSVLSHELRTPLNAMLGWTRMLQSGGLDETRTAQAIETIERNARLQNNLIEDLLDVSRIISGKMRIEKDEVDIVSTVKNCVQTAKPSAHDKSLSLIFESDLISQTITGDATRLQQIVNNLLNNAVKFTPAGGKIFVTLQHLGDKVRLKVKDSGIGITPDFLPKIFDRFRQADSTTKRSHTGLGLGLTIVRHLTELHGGTVEVASDGEGSGATFTIDIPIAPAHEAVAFGEIVGNGKNDLRLKGAKILLVDDDCEGIQPLQILLETQEAHVSCAESAREALAKIAEQRFDILVSDIGMPEMDGLELINEVRKLTSEQNYRLPAIALTAYAASEDRERVLSAGYQTHLAKPVDFDQFLFTVDNLLDR